MNRRNVRGTQLPPEAQRFSTPGGHALMYDSGMGLQIYTVDELKLSWWKYLGIISSHDRVGDYHCVGTDGWDTPFDEWLPLYLAADVPYLSRPTAAPIHLVDAVRYKQQPDSAYWWGQIAHARYKTLRITAQYALQSGADLHRVKPKFDMTDFVVWKKHIYCLDPFRDIALSRLLAGE